MRLGRGLALVALALGAGCAAAGRVEQRSAETLGTLPDDLPLPPRFHLDPERGESVLGPGARRCTIFLAGPFDALRTEAFFRDHLRLARWTREEESGGGLVFRKGEERVVVRLTADAGGGCRVRVDMVAVETDGDAHGRDGK